jgi:hypothetical protein
VDEFTLDTDDGAALTLSWYRRADLSGSAVLYLHGSGMIHRSRSPRWTMAD